MKSISKQLGRGCIQCNLANPRVISYVSSYKYSEQIQIEKNLEVSYTNDDNESDGAIIQKLTESKAFQQVSSPDAIYRNAAIDNAAMRRQRRITYPTTKNPQLSGIIHAKSVAEIRKTLKEFKPNLQPRRKPQNDQRSIMDILDSIAQQSNATNNKDAENDKDTENDKEEEIDQDNDSKQNNVNISKDLREAYTQAILRCSELKEFDQGFKIFEEGKSKSNVCCPTIFVAAMRLQMDKQFDNDSMLKCIEMMEEMQTKYNKTPSSMMYAELITSAVGLKQFRRANGLVKKVIQSENSYNYLRSQRLRNVIINFYAKSKQIDQGIKFFIFFFFCLLCC